VRLCHPLAASGGRPYLVGGGARDRLLGRAPKDLDIEVYGLAADAVRAACARVGTVDEVGASFAVLKVAVGGQTVDVSLPRRESRTGRGHRDVAVAAHPSMSPSQAR
jgi:tRNA nucleotidyltransferase (CCA-adding enzyme)